MRAMKPSTPPTEDEALAAEMAAALAAGEISPDDLVEMVAEVADPEAERREAQNRRMRVDGLGRRLLTLANEQVQQRQVIEERWYKDVRQFNGQYDPGMFGDENEYGSRVFVPLTRRLCGLVEARLFDMLFPSDERNYVIEPTPVPDLDEAMALADQLPEDTQIQSPEGPMIAAGAMKESIGAILDKATKACDAMQREIDDQLAECSWPRHARDSIHDAVLYGTGVLKGPVPMFRTTKRWNQDPQTGAYMMSLTRKPLPTASRVDLWNFFPDMSATHIRDAEFVFERHYLTRQEAADLQNMPDVDPGALRAMMAVEPTVPSSSNYRERLRAISGTSGARDRRYEVWEYHGPITAQELNDCGCAVEDDPLKTYTGVVWFGNRGEVLKAALNALDSNEHPYSVFTWQMDEASIFGFGMPYEVRDNQESANSAFRAMHDNMGLCVLPQVAVDDSAIEPVDGSWRMAPGKFWRIKKPGDVRAAIQFVNMESRLEELQAIFGMSKQLIEEVGTLPAFLQGTEAPNYMQSATGASIAYNAANLWVRRAVRNWDDDIVTPLITRFFDWNMQYSEKAEIKGDSRVRALGIAALVELEGMANRLQAFMDTATKMGLPPSNQMRIMREFARAYKLDPDTVLPTEQEIAKMQQAEQQQGPKQDPAMAKLELDKQRMQLDAQIHQEDMAMKDRQIASSENLMNRRMQLEIADTAAREGITQQEAMRKYGFEAQKTQAELADRQAERDHKSQMLNAEMTFAAQNGRGV